MEKMAFTQTIHINILKPHWSENLPKVIQFYSPFQNFSEIEMDFEYQFFQTDNRERETFA